MAVAAVDAGVDLEEVGAMKAHGEVAKVREERQFACIFRLRGVRMG